MHNSYQNLILILLIPIGLSIILSSLDTIFKSKKKKKTTYKKTKHITSGTYAENCITYYLKHIAEPHYILTNIYLPRDNNETTEIDVLLILSSGIYVFESKDYSGWIFGTENQKYWTQTLPSKNNVMKTKFLNPIMQNKLHIKSLTYVLRNFPPIKYHFCLVFGKQCKLKSIKYTNNDACVINLSQLAAYVNYISRSTGNLYTLELMTQIYNYLLPYSNVTQIVINKHIQDCNKKDKSY